MSEQGTETVREHLVRKLKRSLDPYNFFSALTYDPVSLLLTHYDNRVIRSARVCRKNPSNHFLHHRTGCVFLCFQITTAVNFLTNPNVKSSSLQHKQRFLRNKGLTEAEIQLACERAGLFSGEQQNVETKLQTVINMDRRRSYSVWKSGNLSTFAKVKEALSSVALFSGVAYAIYLFYKRYIEPFLFGRKKKNFEEKIDDLTVKVNTDMRSLSQEVARVKEELERNTYTEPLKREIQSLKTDLESIKGLLLNKKQFASPNLPVVPPSIPSWQLDTARHDPNEEDKNDDAGSGSSETEVVTKNSDSSLEIM